MSGMFTKNVDKAILYCVCIFSDVEGVLRRANNTEFGLASGVFTKNIDKALHVADSLQAGTVFVNTYNKTDVAAPFGGFKQSGFGKDLGKKYKSSLAPIVTKTFPLLSIHYANN